MTLGWLPGRGMKGERIVSESKRRKRRCVIGILLNGTLQEFFPFDSAVLRLFRNVAPAFQVVVVRPDVQRVGRRSTPTRKSRDIAFPFHGNAIRNQMPQFDLTGSKLQFAYEKK